MNDLSFIDIHSHALHGVDDGADSEEMTMDMIKTAYENGTSSICLTPHYCPEMFGDNTSSVRTAFSRLQRRCAEDYPSMRLFLGNEINFSVDSYAALQEGKCLSMADGKYVLLDFFFYDSIGADFIANAAKSVLRIGYIPIIAHIERYSCLYNKFGQIKGLKSLGTVLQMNAGSIINKSRKMRNFSLKLVGKGLIDVIASDAHKLDTRSPNLLSCAELVTDKFGIDVCRRLMHDNPERIIRSLPLI